MPPSGRERRRQGPVNRLRRLLYGILLLAASPGAIAADELAAVGQHRPQPSAPARIVQATLQGLVLLHAERVEAPDTPIQGAAYPRIALDTVTARLLEPAAMDTLLLRIEVHQDGLLRDGVGFDLEVPDFGMFHLNLYSRRNAATAGKRWALGVGDTGVDPPSQTWSLGGTLEMVRTTEGGRHLAFVPELLVDLARGETRYLPFQASLKLAHWRSLSEREALDDVVPQLAFRWRL